MTTRYFLYLDAQRLSVYVWQHNRLALDESFSTDESGLGFFSQYVQNKTKCEYSLLVNLAEEGHVVETIPYLQGNDRQALITRKVGQHFLGSPLAMSLSLGYEKLKRKNERVLISALTNPALVEPWTQRINDASIPLTGIYSIAQLSGLLLKKIGFNNARCLLLTQQEHSIRESYLVDGHTLFSRMAPVHDSSIAGIASSFSTETGKLHQYLLGQRLVTQGEQLPVFIIAHPKTLSAIEESLPERPQLSFTVIDCHDAAKKIGLHTPPEDQHSELLFLHLLATAAPRQQFAGEKHRHDFRLSQIRRAIIATGIVTLLGSALFSAKELYQVYSLGQETQAFIAAEAESNWRYREISATFPQLGIDNDTLRRLTARHADLSQQQRQPGTAYRNIGRALNQIPSITLDSLEWKIGRSGLSTLGPAVGSMVVAPGATSLATAALTGDTETTLIRGKVHPERNATARSMLSTFDQFVKLLGNDPAFSVTVTQQPFDMESGRALRGGDNEDEGMQPRSFALEVSRKITP